MKLNGPGFGEREGGYPPTSLVLKLLFTKDETGCLFGFDGVLLSQLQQYTGADVTVSFGDCDEYVVRVAGTLDQVCHTCNLVWTKLKDYNGTRRLAVRIAAAGNQCGSIIGRNGAKVNEIRDKTGAAISVCQAFLPNSNERVVEIAGDAESCLRCAHEICGVLLESPPRHDTVPYVPVAWDDPDGGWRPVFLCGDRAYVVDGKVARLAPPELLRKELSKRRDRTTVLGGSGCNVNRQVWVGAEPMFRLLAQNRGAVLGEIERMSGARVHLGGPGDVAPSGDVPVALSGTEDAVLLAQFLIQSNLDAASKAARGRPHFVSEQGEAFCAPNQWRGGQGPFRGRWRER